MATNKYIEDSLLKVSTAIAAVLAVFVSVAQVLVAAINNDKELELARMQSEAASKLEMLKSDRTWNKDVANFLVENEEKIFSDDLKTRESMKSIMLATFPPEVTETIFSNFSEVVSSEFASEWVRAKSVASRIGSPTAYLQIVEGFPRKIIDSIGDTIGEGAVSFHTSDEYVNESMTRGDVRYFHTADEIDAKYIIEGFEQIACFHGYKMNLQLFPMLSNKNRNVPGTLEVWLSPAALKKIDQNEVKGGETC